MKDKKLQVFVSSTYTDLKEERQAAVEAILSSGNIPAGMELFAAGDESQMTVIERWIDESDVYLLILGGRYGSIEKKSGLSYTQLEYQYALSKGKPLFAVVVSDTALDKKVKKDGRLTIEQDHPDLLKSFKEIVLGNLVKFWDDKKDIKLAIHETLSDFSYRKELIGWIKGDNAVNSGTLAEELARLTKENSELREKLKDFTNNATSYYLGLTYNELKNLINNESIGIDGFENLFAFLIAVAPKLVNGSGQFNAAETFALNQLRKYKLVYVQWIGGSTIYRFTDDGHNFYLRALVTSDK